MRSKSQNKLLVMTLKRQERLENPSSALRVEKKFHDQVSDGGALGLMSNASEPIFTSSVPQ